MVRALTGLKLIETTMYSGVRERSTVRSGYGERKDVESICLKSIVLLSFVLMSGNITRRIALYR